MKVNELLSILTPWEASYSTLMVEGVGILCLLNTISDKSSIPTYCEVCNDVHRDRIKVPTYVGSTGEEEVSLISIINFLREVKGEYEIVIPSISNNSYLTLNAKTGNLVLV